jgi:hypothetical protein
MRKTLLATLAAILAAGCSAPPPAAAAPRGEGPWWRRPQRLLQTNLREIDAAMDLDAYLREVRESGASVVLFNVGGIVANYPTDLPFHYRNPHMKGDLAGTVLKRLHADGLRMIGRFDFSKVNEAIAAQHPDWLYVGEKGQTVNYNGQVHACFNGAYQQEKLFEILGEALERYPLDGIFFNMPGYGTTDYGGVYHGICQSGACRRRFSAATGLELPPRRNAQDPAYRKYEEFCQETSDALYARIQQFVKSKRPGLLILNYRASGSDVIRSESNRPYPGWAHEDTEKARRHRLLHPDQPLANAAVHFIHYPQRHSGVSTFVTSRRLLQHMVQAQWVDFYCIGPLQRLEDRLALGAVRDIFRFHAGNDAYFRDLRPMADAALVLGAGEEYRGLFDALSEHHMSFDLASAETSDLAAFPLVIIPDAGRLGEEACRRLDAYVETGGRLLLTGEAPPKLRAAGVREIRRHGRTPGTYVRIRAEDRPRLRQGPLEDLDLVFLDGPFVEYAPEESTEGLLRFIPAAMFGPPEKCYYTGVSDTPGLFLSRRGRGACALIPWPVGAHYAKMKHPGHAALVLGAVEGLLRAPRTVRVEASPLVEIQHMRDEGGRFEWVSLVNLSGQKDGPGYFEPVPMRDIEVEILPRRPAASARLLKAGREIPLESRPGGRAACRVPELGLYEIVLFSYRDR